MDWITQNWQTIALIVTGTMAIASQLAALTPSKKDDDAVTYFRKVWAFLAGNYGNAKNKQDPS